MSALYVARDLPEGSFLTIFELAHAKAILVPVMSYFVTNTSIDLPTGKKTTGQGSHAHADSALAHERSAVEVSHVIGARSDLSPVSIEDHSRPHDAR